MNPILVENNYDCTVSVQIISLKNGDKPLPKEILILIEDDKGDHLSTFTVQQARKLIEVLHSSIVEITGSTES